MKKRMLHPRSRSIMRSSSNRANGGAPSGVHVTPASSLRTTPGYAPTKSVFGSRYWIGGYGSKAGADAGEALATAGALGTGAGVVLADTDGEGVGTEVAGVHMTISSDASVASETAR